MAFFIQNADIVTRLKPALAFKYGGTCDPSDEEDCLHCDSKISLAYGKEPVQDFVITGNSLTAEEIAEIAKAEYKSIQNIMDRPDYDSSFWCYF